jgi:hypothetical protein
MISVGSTPTSVDRVHLITSWQSGQIGDSSFSNERLSLSTMEANFLVNPPEAPSWHDELLRMFVIWRSFIDLVNHGVGPTKFAR